MYRNASSTKTASTEQHQTVPTALGAASSATPSVPPRSLPIPAAPTNSLPTYNAANNNSSYPKSMVSSMSKNLESSSGSFNGGVYVPSRRDSFPSHPINSPQNHTCSSMSYLGLKNGGYINSGGQRGTVASRAEAFSLPHPPPQPHHYHGRASVSFNESLNNKRPPTPLRPNRPAAIIQTSKEESSFDNISVPHFSQNLSSEPTTPNGSRPVVPAVPARPTNSPYGSTTLPFNELDDQFSSSSDYQNRDNLSTSGASFNSISTTGAVASTPKESNTVKDKLNILFSSINNFGRNNNKTEQFSLVPRDPEFLRKNNLFVGQLDHCIDEVYRQCEYGNYLVKRLSNYTERIASAANKFAETLHVESKMEAQHFEKICLDQNTQYVAAYKQLQETTIAFATIMEIFSKQVEIGVSQTLSEAHKDNDARRKQLKSDHSKHNNDLIKHQEQLARSNTKCRNGWTTLVQLENENIRAREILGYPNPTMESSSSQNIQMGNIVLGSALGSPANPTIHLDEKLRTKTVTNLKKSEKGVRELNEKLFKEFTKCRDDVDKVRVSQEKYHTGIVPDLMRQFEELERSRLLILKEGMNNYSALFTKLSESAPLTRKLLSICQDLNVEDALVEYVQNLKQQFGPPVDYTPAKLELPCPPEVFGNKSLDWKQFIHLEFGASGESFVIPHVYRCDSGWEPVNAKSQQTSLYLPKGSYILVTHGDTNKANSAMMRINRSASVAMADYSKSLPAVRPNQNGVTTMSLQSFFDPPNLANNSANNTPISISSLTIDDDEYYGELITIPRTDYEDISVPMPLTTFCKGSFPSHVVTRVQPDEHMPLAYLLYCPDLCKLFKEHLQREYSYENYEFWEAARKFRMDSWKVHRNPITGAITDTPDATPDLNYTAMINQAVIIMTSFVDDNARSPVNLKGNVRSALLEANSQKKYHPLMFIGAEEEIYKLLSQDSLSRFKKTPVFSEYLAQFSAFNSLYEDF